MDPAEKLLADVQYWEHEERDAEKRLRYARAVLPNLRESLERLRSEGAVVESKPAKGEPTTPTPTPIPTPAPADGEKGQGQGEQGEPRLRGQASEQVEQALARKSPQSSLALENYLKVHGKAYSRGAIDYALRDLNKAGKIREAYRDGNLRYWEPASLNPADPA